MVHSIACICGASTLTTQSPLQRLPALRLQQFLLDRGDSAQHRLGDEAQQADLLQRQRQGAAVRAGRVGGGWGGDGR
eukprot:scaffold241306_cov14-Tisochrysis_lutea.AAC.1